MKGIVIQFNALLHKEDLEKEKLRIEEEYKRGLIILDGKYNVYEYDMENIETSSISLFAEDKIFSSKIK